MRKEKRTILLAVLAAAALTGCGQEKQTASQVETAETGAEKIQVAYATNGYPLFYQDEKGNFTGYEIEVMKLVDEALPQYEFEYSEAQQDAIYTGLSSGKYGVALTNAFYTEQRAQNYNIPQNQLGASPIGIVVRKEDEAIKSFEELAEKGYEGAPTLAGDGLTYQLDLYNAEHPDAQLQYDYSDSPSSFMDSISFVAEGRYDFTIWPLTYWTAQVEAEDGPLHPYAEKLTYHAYLSVPTYCMISKGDDELSEAISGELGKLMEDGTLVKISEQFYGFNVFEAGK